MQLKLGGGDCTTGFPEEIKQFNWNLERSGANCHFLGYKCFPFPLSKLSSSSAYSGKGDKMDDTSVRSFGGYIRPVCSPINRSPDVTIKILDCYIWTVMALRPLIGPLRPIKEKVKTNVGITS